MASEDQAGQQRRRRLRKGSRQTLGGTIRVAASNCCAYDCRRQHPIAASLWAIFAVILLSPMFDVLARMMGVGFVVFAAPCMTGNSTAVQGGERSASVSVSVTPATGLNLTIFNCEGGNFDVCWSGAVNVTETIHIGRGTTVHIQGNTTRCNHSDAAYMAESGSSTTGDSGNTSTGHDELNELTTILSIPRGPTSAAVRTAPPDTSGDFKESPSFGPIFFVDGGELFIENMAIRGGLTTNSSDNPTDCGAGIHAKNSTVKASSCEFEDNIAESAGGGVFGVYSTLEMVDSVFRRCEAGSQGEAGDEDVNGAGGAISVSPVSALSIINISDVVVRTYHVCASSEATCCRRYLVRSSPTIYCWCGWPQYLDGLILFYRVICVIHLSISAYGIPHLLFYPFYGSSCRRPARNELLFGQYVGGDRFLTEYMYMSELNKHSVYITSVLYMFLYHLDTDQAYVYQTSGAD